jgi:ketosteroid isomerase-like protein
MKTAHNFTRLLLLWIGLSALAGFAQNSPAMSNNEKIVRQYYTAYETKDWSLLEAILSPDFTFTSPAGDDHIDLAEYKKRCWPNSANTKKFEIEKILVSGDDAFVTYNGVTNHGNVFRNTEYFKLKDGKILKNECFFGPGVSFPNNEPKK